MLNDDERSRLVRRAGIIALAGNIFLSIIKIAFAFLSKSLAVLGDSIDSATDVG
ncbi:MAG: cation transporter, partial [Treponema sp.]|nr:cation transporter [Treponema sp.]